jgi:hypothetical protein
MAREELDKSNYRSTAPEIDDSTGYIEDHGADTALHTW